MTLAPRTRRALVLATATVVSVLASAWGHVRRERARIVDVVSAPAAPVAVVLGARVYEGGIPCAVLEDRLATALDLHRAGKVPKLIVSGDHGTRDYDEPTAMARWLEVRGVPSRVIFRDHAGFDTHDSLARARTVFGVERALVVSQEFHLPRALYLARLAGIEATGVRADRRPYPRQRWYETREVGASLKAVLVVGLAKTRPRFTGPPISLEGDGRLTDAPTPRR